MNFSLAIVLLAIAATVAFSQNVTNSTGPCCFDTAFAVAPNMMKVNASTTAPLASSDFHSLVLNGTDNGVHLGNIQDALSSGMNVSDAVARLLMAQNATTAVPN